MKKIFILLSSGIISYSAYSQTDSSFFTVRLSSFDVSFHNNISKLHWKTVCFLQYANFEIQRSANGIDYSTISSFTADRLRCQQPFDFVDSLTGNPGSIFYRINVGNIDGTFYHSAIRRVSITGKGFGLVNVYPTIVSGNINFSVISSDKETFRAIILDQRGIIIKEQQNQAPKGLSNYNIQMGNLPAGYYWLQVTNDKGEVKTEKFIKQ